MSTIDFSDIPAPQRPKPPSSLLVRYGSLRLVGEFAYDGGDRPMCGARMVVKTRRGTELAEVLGTTCDCACPKRVTPEAMGAYIDKSGGSDFPFSTEGRVLRIADEGDFKEQSRMDQLKPQYIAECRDLLRDMELPMKLVDVEMLLGGEMTTFFFLSEHRVDFRNLVKQLAQRFHCRIQMHQVGSRDEARLVADYETCGQPCCCRQFLKVLRPVSMGSAKMQKATLDPSKISGRCGRLKCCLRYEDATYEELRKKLPRVGTRVRTADGIGVVEETTILTQLVKVRFGEDRVVAVANEELLERDVKEGAPELPPPPRPKPQPEPARASEPQTQEQPPQERPARPERPRRGADRPPRETPREDRPAAAQQPEERQPRPARGNRPRRGDAAPAPQRGPSTPPLQPTPPPPAAAAPTNITPPPPPIVPPTEPVAHTGGGTDNPSPGGIGSLGRRHRHRGRGR